MKAHDITWYLSIQKWYSEGHSSDVQRDIQGISFGFDIMYLALADRNMQVRFGLKVVWEF